MKQTPIIAHSAIAGTATSAEIATGGANIVQVDVEITGAGTWKIDLQGSRLSGGTFKAMYDTFGNQLTTNNITASRMQTFYIVADYIKVVATEVVDGATCTVYLTPVY
jgi:hypothetical protein